MQSNDVYTELFQINWPATKLNIKTLFNEIMFDNRKEQEIINELISIFHYEKATIQQWINLNNNIPISSKNLFLFINIFDLPHKEVIIYNYEIQEYENTLNSFINFMELFYKDKTKIKRLPTDQEIIQYKKFILREPKNTISEILGALPLLTTNNLISIMSEYNSSNCTTLNAQPIINKTFNFVETSQHKKASLYYLEYINYRKRKKLRNASQVTHEKKHLLVEIKPELITGKKEYDQLLLDFRMLKNLSYPPEWIDEGRLLWIDYIKSLQNNNKN